MIDLMLPETYWSATDRRIARETRADQQAARLVNGENILKDAVPFGTPMRRFAS